MTLIQRDAALIWHPFTQAKTEAAPLAIASGKGGYLFDDNCKSYMDLISSWWVNLHGHSHPAIAAAIYRQAQQLDHVLFAGCTHEPAVALCEKLQSLLPNSLCRFFYSDNGSTAVEVALKMAYQYWFNQGRSERKLYLSFDGAYHGDTFGAMAVGQKSHFHDPFHDHFFQVLTVPFPATWPEDEALVDKEAQALAVLENHLQQQGEQIAALIFEPLVQGASGMRMCRPEFLQQVIAMVRRYDILVIHDEVMTGFGRLGTYFAVEQLGLEPDFICLSKGITGGSLPLALTVTTQAVYEAFLSERWDKAFTHGHSYTANPIACAAALASFELLLKPETLASIQHLNQAHQNGLATLCQEFPEVVQQARCHGTIAAFALNLDSTQKHYVKEQFVQRGLLIRPLSETVYLLPPYCLTAKEIAEAYAIIGQCLRSVDSIA